MEKILSQLKLNPTNLISIIILAKNPKSRLVKCRRKSYQKIDLEYIYSIFDQVRPVLSHIEFHLPKKPTTLKIIVEGSKFHHRQARKEVLSVQYDKNKNTSIISAPATIKSIPDRTKVLCSLITPIIREGDCPDAWKFVASHCEDGSSHIK